MGGPLSRTTPIYFTPSFPPEATLPRAASTLVRRKIIHGMSVSSTAVQDVLKLSNERWILAVRNSKNNVGIKHVISMHQSISEVDYVAPRYRCVTCTGFRHHTIRCLTNEFEKMCKRKAT